MKFYHNIQRHLLLHYPLVYSTRAFPALLVGVSVIALLFIFFASLSNQIESSSAIASWIAFLVLCCIIAVIIYLIYLFRFNVFKNFGKAGPLQFSLQFLLIFLSIGMFVFWPFIPRIAAHSLLSARYNEARMIKDIHEAYQLAYQMEHTRWDAPYRISQIYVNPQEYYGVDEDWGNNTIKVGSLRDLEKNRFEKLEKKSDSLYLGYEKTSLVCSEYDYRLLNPTELSDSIYANLPETKGDIQAQQERLGEIFSKYIPDYNGSVLNRDSRWSSEFYYGYEETTVCSKYRLSELGDEMRRINEKVISQSDLKILWRVWFYISLYATVLILIFRYMTLRTYFWTILFTFLLFVFTVILTIITEPGEIGMHFILLFYYFICAGFGLSIFFSKSRNVFQGIGLNLSYFFLQLLPIVLASVYYEFIKYDDDHWTARIVLMERAEIVGIILLLISTFLIHNRLFHKWYSLPEE